MFYGMMGKCGRWCHNKSVGVLVLRVVLGAFFLAHGLNKLLQMDMMIRFFGSIGLVPFWAYVVALAETFSGLALLAGVFLWPAALLITIDMVAAIIKVTGVTTDGVLISFIGGWGPNVIYAAAALCLAWCGPGRYSLGAWLMKRWPAQCKDCKDDHVRVV